MNRAWLMAAPLAAALLLGGWQYWPSADATAPSPSPQHAGPASPLVRQAAPPPDKGSLQARHEAFLAAEGSLTVPTDPGLASLQKLFDEREQLRRQRFTPVEQEQLFAEDRLMEQWTLRRKALAEASERIGTDPLPSTSAPSRHDTTSPYISAMRRRCVRVTCCML